MDRLPELRPYQDRRVERAMRAKETRHKTIPDLLRSCPRAKHGIAKAELIVDPPAVVESPQDGVGVLPQLEFKIRVNQLDTLSAAARISDKVGASKRNASTSSHAQQQSPRVAVLNMASAIWPGGNFLEGGNRQEEYLCARTTLYPSLWNAWYPLPEISGVYTPDVLVFRDNLADCMDLPKNDRYFIDVISSSMPRFGDSKLEGCTCGVSYCDRHKDIVMRKMKAVMRIAQSKGVEKLVLGAWGCGKLGNPVSQIAKFWRKVIAGGPRQRRPNAERWDGIKEIHFAIPDRDMRHEFMLAFQDILADDAASVSSSPEGTIFGAAATDEAARSSKILNRMAEIELRLDQTSNVRLRNQYRQTLVDLQRELHTKPTSNDEDLTGDDGDIDMDAADEDEYIMPNLPLASDQEDPDFDPNSYIYTQSSTSSPPHSTSPNLNPQRNDPSPFEFRPSAPDLLSSSHPSPETEDESQDEHLRAPSSHPHPHQKRHPPQFDPQTGWYNGSVDGLTAFLQGTGRLKLGSSRGSLGSPEVVRPDSMGGGGGLDVEVLRGYLGRYEGSDVLDY